VGVDVGHKYIGGFAKQTGTWGRVAPIVVGANQAFEFNSHSIDSKIDLVMNNGLFGSPYRRKGSPGNVMPGGDFECDLYYRDDPVHAMLAQIFGVDTYTALGGGAHQHDLVMQTGSQIGIFGTLVFPGPEGILELGSAKLVGCKISWDGTKQRTTVSFSVESHDINENVGSPIDNFVVVSVAAANGPLTITGPAALDFGSTAAPSPLFTTIVPGITAITVTTHALDRFGNYVTIVQSRAAGDFVSDVATSQVYVRKVLDSTISGLTGSGNIKIGITNGANNATTVTSLTTATDRDCELFSQLRFMAGPEAGASPLALATSSADNDEFFLSKLEIDIKWSQDSRVTTQFGNRRDEMVLGGGGWPTVGVTGSFSAYCTNARRALFAQRAKDGLRAQAVLTGPPVPASSPVVAQSMNIYLNDVQFASGDKKVSGPGVIPIDFAGEAHQAVAVPTGFPAGTDEPCMIRFVDGRSSAYI
jgi:hypothetical protein